MNNASIVSMKIKGVNIVMPRTFNVLAKLSIPPKALASVCNTLTEKIQARRP